MVKPKFKVDDVVMIIVSNSPMTLYKIKKSYGGLNSYIVYDIVSLDSLIKKLVYESSLQLVTPEDRTKLLLGIDLHE